MIGYILAFMAYDTVTTLNDKAPEGRARAERQAKEATTTAVATTGTDDTRSHEEVHMSAMC